MSSGPNDRFVDGYDPSDFGADGIQKVENWKDSGYTHYTAYSETGGQISWNVAETADGERYVANPHMSDSNAEGSGKTSVWD